jgi:UDP-galactopyranose mutase
MSRDIVQFVPFREFKRDVYKLAKETLQEIPGQLTSFFMSRNIFPRPFKEEERQKIAAQLSLKSKIDPSKKIDQYQ